MTASSSCQDYAPTGQRRESHSCHPLAPQRKPVGIACSRGTLSSRPGWWLAVLLLSFGSGLPQVRVSQRGDTGKTWTAGRLCLPGQRPPNAASPPLFMRLPLNGRPATHPLASVYLRNVNSWKQIQQSRKGHSLELTNPG